MLRSPDKQTVGSDIDRYSQCVLLSGTNGWCAFCICRATCGGHHQRVTDGSGVGLPARGLQLEQVGQHIRHLTGIGIIQLKHLNLCNLR